MISSFLSDNQQIMSKKVLIIQHTATVLPAYSTIFLSEHHIPFEILHIYQPDCQSKFPDDNTDDYSAIISLGGSQAAYEDDIYPYLKWEKAFLTAQLARNTPILGLCLGAQLLANVVGGTGHLGRYGSEVGYVQYRLTSEGEKDSVIGKVFAEQNNQPLLIMHHQDSFDLPSNIPVLAYTSNNYIAAFRFGSALAVQFHPEASLTEFNGWVERTQKREPESYAHLDIDGIAREVQAFELQASRSRQLFFETWWNSLQV